MSRRKKINGWFSWDRNYLHFDVPVGFRKAFRIVSLPENVAKWNFFPFLQVEVVTSKIYKDENRHVQKKDKVRKISYASHMDSNIYSYYSLILSSLYEKIIQDNDIQDSVLAFRKIKSKCNIHFAKDAFDYIEKVGNCYVYSYDVKSYFDEIDPDILKNQWAKLLGGKFLPKDHYAVYKSLVGFRYVLRDFVFLYFGINRNSKKQGIKRICSIKDFRDHVRGKGMICSDKSGKGIPQGSPISGLLSNVYLLDFDIKVKQFVKLNRGRYYRYCDDIMIIIPDDRLPVANVDEVVTRELKRLCLRTNEKKNVRRFKRNKNKITCDKPVQFLGFVFDGKSAYIRSASISRGLYRLRRAAKLAKSTKNKYNRIRESKGQSRADTYKSTLYKKHSYIGRRNFVAYAHRAAGVMAEKKIKKQVKPFWKLLQKELS